MKRQNEKKQPKARSRLELLETVVTAATAATWHKTIEAIARAEDLHPVDPGPPGL